MEGTIPILCVRGDLDVLAWRRFPEEVNRLAREASWTVVDLSEVTYIDLRGIRELERLDAAMRARQGSLVIANPSAIVRRVLEVLEIDTQLPLASSRQEALAYIAGHAGRPVSPR